MKSSASLLAALLIASSAALAAEPVNFDVYIDGKLQHHVSLSGPHSGFKFWVPEDPTTVLEMKLVAPEPIILEVQESTGDAQPHASGRLKLVGKGGSAAVADLKGAKFRHPYVLVRPE